MTDEEKRKYRREEHLRFADECMKYVRDLDSAGDFDAGVIISDHAEIMQAITEADYDR